VLGQGQGLELELELEQVQEQVQVLAEGLEPEQLIQKQGQQPDWEQYELDLQYCQLAPAGCAKEERGLLLDQPQAIKGQLVLHPDPMRSCCRAALGGRWSSGDCLDLEKKHRTGFRETRDQIQIRMDWTD